VRGVCICAFLDNLVCYAECCGETLQSGDEEIVLNLANDAHASQYALETEYLRQGFEKVSIVPVDVYDSERARIRLGIGHRRSMRQRDQLKRAKLYHKTRAVYKEHYKVRPPKFEKLIESLITRHLYTA